jgi:uncharacterized protein YyaL (SSP411 family)
MWDGKTLKRRYRDGDVRFDGSLDDYAFVISGLVDLYETDFDGRWFESALALQKRSDELFWDAKDGGYFFTAADDPSLIARSKDIYDGAVPSGNSVAALNLLRLHGFTLDRSLRDKADALVKAFSEFVSAHPQASPALLMAVDFATDASREIVVAGTAEDKARRAFVDEIHRIFLPNKVLEAGGNTPLAQGKGPIHGKAAVYLCEAHACRKPSTDIPEVLAALRSAKNYSLS